MLNRKSPPPIRTVSNLTLPRPAERRLANGVPVFVLDWPGQEIVKLEVVFRAGRPEEHKRLAARATARLMREGTRTRSAGEIAEHIDFFGGSISIPTNLDTANFTLFALRKYFADLLPVFADVLHEPSFPEREIETFRRTSIQDLQVELEKPEVLAYRKITELIFGEAHPYGYNSVAADYEALTRDDLVRHFERWFVPGNCMIFASGRVDAEVLDLMDKHFGQDTRRGDTPHFTWQTPAEKPRKIALAHPGSMQKAIKIGRRLFDKKHPDYAGMFVLNTILGGYFGSRLMTNIREKKGYTYNIYSTADSMWHDGCFYIATEVNPEAAPDALRQIRRELKKLRDVPVPEAELSMVRNYLLGTLLNGLDGPINASDLVKGMLVEDLPLTTFDHLVETIRTVSAEGLQALAQQYLQPKDFWEVVVG